MGRGVRILTIGIAESGPIPVHLLRRVFPMVRVLKMDGGHYHAGGRDAFRDWSLWAPSILGLTVAIHDQKMPTWICALRRLRLLHVLPESEESMQSFPECIGELS